MISTVIFVTTHSIFFFCYRIFTTNIPPLSFAQLTLIWNIGYYTSPLIITFLYRRGYFVAESISTLAKVSTGIGLLVVISLCIRSIGRSTSVNYTKFVKALEAAKSDVSSQSVKEHLRMFDFDFSAWPVDFNVKDVSG